VAVGASSISSGGASILHVDMDAFFVSVELLERPDLRGRPVVVGGTGRRGVVAAASYEARRFGVRSAMSSARARRLCPEAVFLPARHDAYLEASRRVMDVLRSFTPLVEPISVDEAFMEVSGSRRLFGEPADVARAVRSRILGELSMTASVGIAATKSVAKLASEAAKPRAGVAGVEPGPGVVVVPAGQERDFLAPLPVEALWGVGPVTAKKLHRIGIRTVGELAELDEDNIVAVLGAAHGRHLWELARGVDPRPVVAERDAKSIGHEETFAEDIDTAVELHRHLVRLSEAVARRVREHGGAAGTVMLKVTFSDFRTVTRSVTSAVPLTTGPAFVAALEPALASLDVRFGVRLLGVHAQKLDARAQPGLFDDAGGSGSEPGHLDPSSVEARWLEATEALDRINRRFGDRAIGPVSGLGSSAPGHRPWGPDDEGTSPEGRTRDE
jgi:DNA polymerase-4